MGRLTPCLFLECVSVPLLVLKPLQYVDGGAHPAFNMLITICWTQNFAVIRVPGASLASGPSFSLRCFFGRSRTFPGILLYILFRNMGESLGCACVGP